MANHLANGNGNVNVNGHGNGYANVNVNAVGNGNGSGSGNGNGNGSAGAIGNGNGNGNGSASASASGTVTVTVTGNPKSIISGVDDGLHQNASNNGNPSLMKAFDKKAKGYLNALHRSFSTSAMEKNALMSGENVDPSTMTIEFLRARLQSQRAEFRAERLRARVLAQKVMELEKKLKIEMRSRRKANSGDFTELNISPNREFGQDECAKHVESVTKTKSGSHEIEEAEEKDEDQDETKAVQRSKCPQPRSAIHSPSHSYNQDLPGEYSPLPCGPLVGERSKKFGAKYPSKLTTLMTNGHHTINVHDDKIVREVMCMSYSNNEAIVKDKEHVPSGLNMSSPDSSTRSTPRSSISGGDHLDIPTVENQGQEILDIAIEKQGLDTNLEKHSEAIPKGFTTKGPSLDIESSGILDLLEIMATTLFKGGAFGPKVNTKHMDNDDKDGDNSNAYHPHDKTMIKTTLVPEEFSSLCAEEHSPCSKSKPTHSRCSKTEMLKLLELIKKQVETNNESRV